MKDKILIWTYLIIWAFIILGFTGVFMGLQGVFVIILATFILSFFAYPGSMRVLLIKLAAPLVWVVPGYSLDVNCTGQSCEYVGYVWFYGLPLIVVYVIILLGIALVVGRKKSRNNQLS